MAEAEVARLVPEPPAPVAKAEPPAAAATPAAASRSVKDDNWRPASQPVRADQVQNAVNFLSHPKVRGSPVQYRRTFLERKGLSREEIDEAFRRVPDPPSSTSANPLPSADAQAAQPGAALGLGQLTSTPQGLRQYRWTQMLLAVGLLASAGAGTGFAFKRWLLPRFKSWIRRIAVDEAADKSKAVQTDDEAGISPATSLTTAAAVASLATAASEIALATQEMIRSRAEEREAHNLYIKAMEAQTKELKTALASMQEAHLDASRRGSPRDFVGDRSVTSGDFNWFNRPASTTNWESQYAARNSIVKSAKIGPAPDIQKGVPSNGQIVAAQQAPGRTSPAHGPHSHNYQEIIAMVERGETPPGIRAVNDKPPNPEQLPSFPQLQPKQKPWEVATSGVLRPTEGISEQSARFTGEKPSMETGAASFHHSHVRSETSSPDSWWRQQKAGSGSRQQYTSSAVQISEVDQRVDYQEKVESVSNYSSSGTASVHGASPHSSARWVPPPMPARSIPSVSPPVGVQEVKKSLVNADVVSEAGTEEGSSSDSTKFQNEGKGPKGLPEEVQNNGEFLEGSTLKDVE